MEKNESGLCACGCGKPTKISKYTSKRFGWVRGKPRKYVRGHNLRKRIPIQGKLPARDWCIWFVGFSDGESSFAIDFYKDRPGSFRCKFSITLRADDEGVLKSINDNLGGSLNYNREHGATKSSIRWSVQGKKDIARVIKLFDSFQLKTKKRADYILWRPAACLWLSGGWTAQEMLRVKWIKKILSTRKRIGFIKERK